MTTTRKPIELTDTEVRLLLGLYHFGDLHNDGNPPSEHTAAGGMERMGFVRFETRHGGRWIVLTLQGYNLVVERLVGEVVPLPFAADNQ